MSKMLDTHAARDFASKASAFAADGFTAVGLYYFQKSAFKQLLSADVAAKVSKAGIFLVSVYENGYPTTADYFTTDTASKDAHVALTRAHDAGQPCNTPIYFAVDFDASEDDLKAILAYFAKIQRVFTIMESPYKIGVYGSGRVCDYLCDRGIATKTWLAQSTGWAGYEDFKDRANIVQGREAILHSLDCDLDVTNGDAGGWKVH